MPWSTREQPILDAIAELSESGNPGLDRIVEVTSLPHGEVQRAVQSLAEADYLTGLDVSTMGTGFDLIEIRLLERGLRATGIWPSDPYDEFVNVLEERLAASTDPAERSRLQRLLDAAIDVGKGAATAVITDVVKRTAGIP